MLTKVNYSKVRYDNLGDEDKKLIPLLLQTGSTVFYISKKYNLNRSFVIIYFHKQIKEKKIIPNDQLYNWDSLSLKEIKAYYKYEFKHKLYYD
tara:strand:+ start:172 stop:450 length:279 start_codon:yes stop_codon:yes gene_type:complete